jgi:hypothetical protein
VKPRNTCYIDRLGTKCRAASPQRAGRSMLFLALAKSGEAMGRTRSPAQDDAALHPIKVVTPLCRPWDCRGETTRDKKTRPDPLESSYDR